MLYAVVISGPFARHVDAPRCSLEKLDPQMPFELLDLLTQRGIGYLQGVRGSREAADLDDSNEGPDCLHVVYDTPPDSESDYAQHWIKFL
jgi:hypothetical protein